MSIILLPHIRASNCFFINKTIPSWMPNAIVMSSSFGSGQWFNEVWISFGNTEVAIVQSYRIATSCEVVILIVCTVIIRVSFIIQSQ